MTYSKNQTYILNLLAKRDYSYQELLDKLTIRKLTLDESVSELKLILEKNWINDTRLTENLILHYSKTRGPNWINQKLRQRKIPLEIIKQNQHKLSKSSENRDQDDYRNLKLKIQRKYNFTNWKELDLKSKAKIWNYLSYHGFNNVGDLIKTLFD